MTTIIDSQTLGADNVLDLQRKEVLPGVTMERGAVVGSAISYTLVLDTEPSADVTVNMTASGTTGHSVLPASITFTTANWDTPQTVTVTVSDAGAQTDLSVIVHRLVSTDPDYSGLVIDEFAPLWTWRTYNPDTECNIDAVGDLATSRALAVQWVWDGAGFPTRLPDSVVRGVTISGTYYNQAGTNNIASVDELNVEITDTGVTWNSKIWHFIPTIRVGKLVVIHQGHSDNLIDNGIGTTIKRFVESGYDVLGVHMPGRGPNTPGSYSDHNTFAPKETLTFNPMRVFIEPIAVAINHAIDENEYSHITMAGVSGGGWSTLFYSALDTRVKTSFPVAGAMPLGIRAANDLGDYEQGGTAATLAFYTDDVSYVDLYLLAATGSGRHCVEIHNLVDSCCFGEYSDQAYVPYVTTRSELLGGDYRFYRDRTVVGSHTISSQAVSVMMSELNSPAESQATQQGSSGVGGAGVSDFLHPGVGWEGVGGSGVSPLF